MPAVTTNPPGSRKARLAERNDAIEREYLAGSSLETIGKNWSMTRERVRQILEARGVERRDSGHYARSAYDSWSARTGAAVDAAFDELHSVARVCASHPEWNPTYVRRYLEPRRLETVQLKSVSKTFPDEQLLEALRVANDELPRLTSAAYGKWRDAQAEAGIHWPAGITITLRFGSWSKAKSLALGAEVPGISRVRAWTPEQAQDAVYDYVCWSLKAKQRPSSAGYAEWAMARSDQPSFAYLRVLTNKTWTELLLGAYARIS